MKEQRTPRADARRNRVRILETAQDVFAVQGLSASMDEIAQRAGVGVGTIYRHFPTKEALFEAIVLFRLEELERSARELAGAVDPGKAFFYYLERMVVEGQGKRDLVDALSAAGVDVKTTLAKASRAHWSSLERLLASAQRAGAVRPDVGISELQSLITAVVRSSPGAPDRLLAVVCDGLRARHAGPAGAPPPYLLRPEGPSG